MRTKGILVLIISCLILALSVFIQLNLIEDYTIKNMNVKGQLTSPNKYKFELSDTSNVKIIYKAYSSGRNVDFSIINLNTDELVISDMKEQLIELDKEIKLEKGLYNIVIKEGIEDIEYELLVGFDKNIIGFESN